MTGNWKKQYLNTLNLQDETPSRRYLKKVIRAHVRTFPFENVSKLLIAETYDGSAPITNVEEFLESHWEYQTGGTCFALNSCLYQLLCALGFEGYLIRPGEEHMAVIIKDPESDGNLLYVDAGTTAPLFDPIPFYGRRHSIPPFAGERLLFLPEKEKGVYTYIRMRGQHIIDKKWTFSVHDAMSIEDFKPWITSTFQSNAVFMNMLRCQVWQPEKRKGLSLTNKRFSVRNGNGAILTKHLPDKDALLEVIHDEFQMPSLPVTKAIHILEQKGIYLFEK
ncbi:arylamine N-acetyltransferase [Salibacterium salarium]|uniref:Arylamine N-acetyltransferase n=1 Tax=Salibacterium salarium TaxID=284579 RepID=A0A428N7I1_9BACI|nr:arylamine N-acetyltransferase [Salibacterium salarium]RSL34346.1 arylamine N-acetyltransferase [Salibacterium salarium]